MTDLRIRRTKRLIQTAFIELVNQIGFKQVTVTKIATTAMINRQTFYHHYTDKYDLAASLQTNFFEGLDHVIFTHRTDFALNLPFHQRIASLHKYISQYILDNRQLVLTLRKTNPGPQSFDQILITRIDPLFSKIIDQPTTALTKQALTYLALGELDYVIDHNRLPNEAEFQELHTTLKKIFE